VVAYLALGVLVLVGLLAVGHWLVNANPRRLLRVLVGTVLAIAVGGGAYLLLTGRLLPALLAVAPFLPFLLRWLTQRQRARSYRGPRAGQASSVETPTLRVRLDHESGAVIGEVRRGQFAGRALEALGLADLLALLAECRADDAQAVAILEAYLDRLHPEWRSSGAGPGDRASAGAGSGEAGGMSRAEAYAVLGLEAGADDAAIRKAHRDLIRKLHPDHGGSTYLAAKINRAKDILLGARP